MHSSDKYRRNQRLGIKYLQSHRTDRRTLGLSKELAMISEKCHRLMANKASWHLISALLERLLQEAPHAPTVWSTHWRALMHNEQYDEALVVAQRYHEHLHNHTSHGLLGKTYVRLNKHALAIKHFQKSLAKHPNANMYLDVHRMLYDLAAQEPTLWATAQKNAESWCRAFHSAEAYQSLGEVLRKRKQYAEALVALANIPDGKRNMQVWLCQGYCYFHLKSWESSLDAFIQADVVWNVTPRQYRQHFSVEPQEAAPRFRWHVGVIFLYDQFVADTRVSEQFFNRFMDRLELLLHISVNWIASQRLDALEFHHKRDFVSALDIIVYDEYLWSMIAVPVE